MAKPKWLIAEETLCECVGQEIADYLPELIAKLKQESADDATEPGLLDQHHVDFTRERAAKLMRELDAHVQFFLDHLLSSETGDGEGDELELAVNQHLQRNRPIGEEPKRLVRITKSISRVSVEGYALVSALDKKKKPTVLESVDDLKAYADIHGIEVSRRKRPVTVSAAASAPVSAIPETTGTDAGAW